MNRRRFLQVGIPGSIGLGATFLFLRRSKSRADATSRMLDDALPSLAANSLRELNTFPARARQEMHRYFLGRCLNVQSFVAHICSDAFFERVSRCRTVAERELCFVQSFCGRVATEAQISNQVETIAAHFGSELDSGWGSYCSELSAKWNTRMRGHGSQLRTEDLSNRLGAIIRTQLAEAARQGISGDRRPAIGETIGSVGQSAILLLPLVRLGHIGVTIGIPLFFLLAAKHVWDHVAAQLEDRRGEYRAAISERLTSLGNRVGAEFEREVRVRLTDLHTWQEGSVRNTAMRLVEERVGLI